MRQLILIRHAETDYNLKTKYCGFSNPPLNSKGILQAKKLKSKLIRLNFKVDRVYSSDLKRASETAKIVFKNKSFELSSDFREMNFGIFEGLNYQEIMQKYPQIYIRWIDEPLNIRLPKGEGLVDLSRRVKRGLSKIFTQNRAETIAIVTHAGPIRIILCEILNYKLEHFWKIKQDISALNIINYPKNSAPVIGKVNDTSHLMLKDI
ncbi:MAG TPA: histidine phosphatase family protein [Candidatus Omnitrophica bacterium]|nr:MAG: alpha-ribazole phosphatase [Candidatus Omnitrophota bacterium]HEC69782.1 histidine phosphatase family protein [Candidatus Omnitrophota bacterium]